jgi:DNA-binding transcriptional LysR family regulator
MVHFAAPASADLDLRRLRYFLAVAHHLNFGRAAEELLLARPAPSRAIQALETDFGVTLFERDHHKVALTPPGAALVRGAETLLARAAAARRRIQAASRPTSTLTVGFRPGIITDAVQQFTREHPETAVNAIRIEWDEQHAAVADGRVDIAWVRTPHRRCRPRGYPAFR